MLRDASQQWNLTAAQVADLDPLVDKLFGACATEIKKIHEEVGDSRTRVLNRLAQLLTPEVLSTPFPAHAVAHGDPTEPETVIDTQLQLIARQSQNPDERFYFSPAGTYLLKDARISYLAHGQKFFTKEGRAQNQELAKAKGKGLPGATLWLGLEVNPKLKDLSGLSFYFHWLDLGSAAEFGRFYHRLELSKWFVKGRRLSLKAGYRDEQAETGLTVAFDEMRRIEQEVEGFHEKAFVRLGTFEETPDAPIDPGSLLEIMPPILESEFPEAAEVITKPLLWIKIQFPESWAGKLLERAEIATNCFPVLNRRLHKYSHWLLQPVNILPLETDQYFLAVHSVQDADKKPIKHIPFNAAQPKLSPRTYSLRWGGTGRYDTRSASDLLAYLFELLRDESAAFKALGYEVLSSDLNKLNQTLNRIEGNISRNNLQAESVPYLVIRTNNPNEYVYIWFWSTHAEAANAIKANSDMEVLGSAKVSHAGLYLVTKPRNGQSRAGEVSKLMEYREALLSRDRLVTPADLKLACQSWLGDLIADVSIQTILGPSRRKKKGLVRKIGVFLTPAESPESSEQDWPLTCLDLEKFLNTRHSGMIEIQVQLINDQ